ncbi:MAG: homogentisate 1,2-dioxygenase, partial [Saprospiraceae bacterium]|nr:homogentisate 1,2-dioxygenase [Saprospiraceae bacterium]
MALYHRLGKIPHKRHTQFEKPNGSGLYYEQLFGTIGFDGMSSLMYHTHRPTMVRDVLHETDLTPKIALERN